MEEFQGQERKIIMVSTVRSSISYVKMDKDFNIGFLSNEKVFLFLLLKYKVMMKPEGSLTCLSELFPSCMYVCMISAEIQRGRDQSQVPADSCGKPCDPQQGQHLEEVRQNRPQEMFYALSTHAGLFIKTLPFSWQTGPFCSHTSSVLGH